MEEQAAEIQAICQRLGMTYEELAAAVAVKPETMRKAYKGYQKVSDAVMHAIRNVEKYRAAAIKEEPLKSEVRPAGPISYSARRKVPVVSWVHCGPALGERGFNYDDLAGQIEEEVETDSKDFNAYALIVEGDSMWPEYLPGDRVIVSPNAEARNGDVVIARFQKEGTVVLKRFKRTGPEGQQVILESTNPHYKTIKAHVADLRFVHPVVEMVRKNRR